MKKKKSFGLFMFLLAMALGIWMLLSKEPETTKEDEKVDQLIKTDKERSDSMKKALGIE